MGTTRVCTTAALMVAGVMIEVGCRPAGSYRREVDTVADRIIHEKQAETFGTTQPFTIERPADTLRRKLMLTQDLPHSSPASLGVRDLAPIKQWPNDDYLTRPSPVTDPQAERLRDGLLRLSLLDALQVAAHNSPEYQSRKESVFETALSLELARDQFRTTWDGTVDTNVTADLGGEETVAGVVSSPQLSARRRLRNGAVISGSILSNLAKLLTGDRSASLGLVSDASIAVPLLRGAGEFIVTEPLTQAERDVVFSLLNFDQYKRTFAVSIASEYLQVLQQYDQLVNAENGYRRVIISARLSRRLADAGRLPPFQVDQAIQEELRARESWISSQRGFALAMDQFKMALGLPPDAKVELDRDELRRLARAAEVTLALPMPTTAATTQEAQGTIPPAGRGAGPTTRPATGPTTQPSVATTQITPAEPADADVVLVPPDPNEAGRLELPEPVAVRLALENRPDLKVAIGQVYDAQRQVVVAADALQMGVDLTVGGTAGSGRGLGSTGQPDARLRPEKGSYSAGLAVDLPLERTAEANQYRRSLINLEAATRSMQTAEDNIKLSIRSRLAELLQARESLKTQSQSVVVARRRVASTDLLLQAGRAQMRDVLESQNSLVNAQNAFTSALVRYRVAELQMQRDLGLLEVNEEGLWREYSPNRPQP